MNLASPRLPNNPRVPTHPDFTIRRATVADVPAVLPMVAAIVAQHEAWDPDRYATLPDVLDRYERWLPARAQDDRGVFLVAQTPAPPSDPPTLVGFLVATIDPNIPIYTLKEYAFIQDLWVEPAHRRRGIARALVQIAIDHLRAQGITQIRLETAAPNDPARRLFESLGFRTSTIDMLLSL